MSAGNEFLETVQNSPEQIKKFLISHGMKGKSTAPISFFREEEMENFIRKNVVKDNGKKTKSKAGGTKR